LITGKYQPGPLAGAILDNLTTAVVIVTAGGHIVFMNAGAEALFGVSKNQAAEREISGLLPGLEDLAELVRRAVRENQTFGQDLNFSVFHEDRIDIQVACRVSPLGGEWGEQLIVEFFDATHRRQVDREKALISQRGVSRRIIRQLAHEIRNPLGGLRGAAQLLERELPAPALREYTQVIIREADRLAGLADSLLGPTRAAHFEPINIHEITERVLLLIEGQIPGDVEITRDYDPSLPTVWLDRDQIIQALLNIARNAMQAVGDSGNLLFRTRALTNYTIGESHHRLVVSVEIEDDGPGIPEEIADSIFYPLVTGREGGTGLGLPLAQDLVSRHGGLIEFDSKPGRTVFVVRLPIEV